MKGLISIVRFICFNIFGFLTDPWHLKFQAFYWFCCPEALITQGLIKLFVITLSSVTDVEMGSLFSLVPLKVKVSGLMFANHSQSYH